MNPLYRFFLLSCCCLLLVLGCNNRNPVNDVTVARSNSSKQWSAPDTSSIPKNDEGDLIRYGRELIVHTSHYLGPNGIVSKTTNGMNCQNCHLDAGTKIWGNNYSAVASTYPKYRARSGNIESIEKRVNDCVERSLNGTPLDSISKEMMALVAYIKWVGREVPKDSVPTGAGIANVALLEQQASKEKGELIFEAKCVSCHGADGQGKKDTALNFYVYPPLWGPHSYTTGAGLYRLSRFAGYVKENMPFNAGNENKLTEEETWNVAAFVNSMPRISRIFKTDWPDKSQKPFDYPFGPYTDTFSETQHKFGPYQVIISAHKK